MRIVVDESIPGPPSHPGGAELKAEPRKTHAHRSPLCCLPRQPMSTAHMKSNRQPPHPATLAAQGLGWTDAATGAVVLPIQPATTYIRDPDNQGTRRGRNLRACRQSRLRPALQALLTALEGGAASLVPSASGMAAATVVFRARPVGAHVVAPQVMYHSLRRGIAAYAADGHIAADFVDMSSARRAARRGAARADTARVGRDAGQPAVVDHRHRRRGRDRAPRRRAARGRQHSPRAWY